jgi:outer membrane lipoprotein-sorting protein
MNRLLIIALLGLIPAALAQNPTEILAKAEKTAVGTSSYSELKMTAQRARYTRELEIKSWTHTNKYALIVVTGPERDRGTRYLRADKQMYSFVPRTGKVVKLPQSMLMAGGFMGTDASMDNLLGQASLAKDFTHEYLGTETVNGLPCHKIKCTPKPGVPVAADAVIAWIHTGDKGWVRLSIQSARNGEQQRMDALEFARMDGVLMPVKLQFSTQGGKQTTVMTVKTWKKQPQLTPAWFTPERLQQTQP